MDHIMRCSYINSSGDWCSEPVVVNLTVYDGSMCLGIMNRIGGGNSAILPLVNWISASYPTDLSTT